ncbi:MAG: redoxin domain-containing protein [Bacteroidia bacterium]|nr:redoxin domain-containing protein [Bacteroidia bacterium]MCX7653027.1 redoxin domain-containing protein [Bacteroidia bacterium]MDW8416165.1 redoxin domain-containing protein [Bacteroidia bacterium]
MRQALTFGILWAGLYAQPEKYPPAQQFPRFLLYTLDGKPFTDKDLPPAQRGRIVFFFDPYCDHCQKQATFLRENPNALKDFQLIWVSTETAESIRKFQENYLKGLTNVFLLRDKDYKFDSFFGYSIAPTIYVYDRTGKLRAVHKEEVPIGRLLQGL